MYIQKREHSTPKLKERQEHSKENMQDRKKVVISRGCKSKEVAPTKNDSLPSSKAIIKSMEGPVQRIGLPAFAQTFAELKDAQSDKLRSRSGFFDASGTKYETHESFCNYSIINHGCMNHALVTAAEHGKRCAGSISVGNENTPSYLCGGFFSSFTLKCSVGCDIQVPFETDYFTKPPDSKVKAGCSIVNDSATMGKFQTAVQNKL